MFFPRIILLIFLTLIYFRGLSQEFESSGFIDDDLKKYWYLKDFSKDSVLGISIEKFEKYKNQQPIIIAVIDTEIEINHPSLKDFIWFNDLEKNGSPNIDDDKNGYIDDVNGWNFIGNLNKENIFYSNYDYVRFLKIYQEKNFSKLTINNDSIINEKYNKLLKRHEREIIENREKLNLYQQLYTQYLNSKKRIKEIIGDNSITIEILDSLKVNKPDLVSIITPIYNSLKYDVKEEDILEELEFLEKNLNFHLNLNLNDREVVGDDPNNLDDRKYGSPFVSENTEKLYHGTLVSGIITKILSSMKIDNIVLMPLAISANGDEYDKDIALAIKYGVDNGAKILNISSSKDFSLHSDWVTDAIKYANQKDVLIITSAGNSGKNIDIVDNITYPSDQNIENIVGNFVTVGASSFLMNKNIVYNRTNYGKNNVDIFAPGHQIYTTSSTNKENEYVSGTSFSAPIVSGIAALLRSYYPNLTAPEIKKILMESGTTYDIDVEITQEDGTKKMVPFSELSKSGKIVNAYKALIMAEQIAAKN